MSAYFVVVLGLYIIYFLVFGHITRQELLQNGEVMQDLLTKVSTNDNLQECDFYYNILKIMFY